MIEWVRNNITWIFSGIGVAIITLLLNIIFRRKSNGTLYQTFKSSSNSPTFQAGGDLYYQGDININSEIKDVSNTIETVSKGEKKTSTIHNISPDKLSKQAGHIFLTKKLPKLAKEYKNIQDKVYNSYQDQKYISLILADVDGLTIINKHYSNAVGDQILSAIAIIIDNLCTNINYNGRCGDDTFYLVLPGFGIKGAMNIANKLCTQIQQYDWNLIAENLCVTCAVSVAQLNAKEVIKNWTVRAAQGLKLAKKKGPNKIKKAPEFLSKRHSKNLRDYYS